MDINKLYDLPGWDEERSLNYLYNKEQHKRNTSIAACKMLYEKWREIVFLLKGILLPVTEAEHENAITSTARQLLSDAHIVGAKIRSAEAGNLYVLKMENAAIIRQLAQGVYTNLLFLNDEPYMDEDYINIVRKEIKQFRYLFVKWVNTFTKDDVEDEWGLFI